MPTIGQGIENATNDLVAGMIHYHKEHQSYDQALAAAEAFSRMGMDKQGRIVPAVDAEGKPVKDVTNIIDKKAIDIYRNVASNKRSEARGALEAMSRMAMHQMDVVRQATAQRGGTPFISNRGLNYIQNPKTGSIKPDTAIARNEQGVPVTVQHTQQMQEARFQQQAVSTARRGFTSAMKGLGFSSPVDIFDPSIHQGGVIDQNGKFVQQGGFAEDAPSTLRKGGPTYTKEGEAIYSQKDKGGMGHYDPTVNYGGDLPPDTHVRVGYQAPSAEINKKTGKPVNPGRTGTVLPINNLMDYQDTAATLADLGKSPDELKKNSIVQALQWYRANPDNKLAPDVLKTIRKGIDQSVTKTVSVPSAPEMNAAPPSDEGDTEEE